MSKFGRTVKNLSLIRSLGGGLPNASHLILCFSGSNLIPSFLFTCSDHHLKCIQVVFLPLQAILGEMHPNSRQCYDDTAEGQKPNIYQLNSSSIVNMFAVSLCSCTVSLVIHIISFFITGKLQTPEIVDSGEKDYFRLLMKINNAEYSVSQFSSHLYKLVSIILHKVDRQYLSHHKFYSTALWCLDEIPRYMEIKQQKVSFFRCISLSKGIK